jgi:hypothetical protein
MTIPEPVLRHKRKPGYDRGSDTELNRPERIKYFGQRPEEDRVEEGLDAPRNWELEEETQLLPVVNTNEPPTSGLKRFAVIMSWISAITMVTGVAILLSGFLALVGVAMWMQAGF